MNPTKTNQHVSKAQRNLAAGILTQARRDLRRFRSARRAPGRELYLDAHYWVISEDVSWPLSFRNVCELLDLSPDVFRGEVLRDTSLSAVDFWSQRSARLLRQCQSSVREMLSEVRYHTSPSRGAFAHTH
jgi:hypothetical protein